MYKKILTYTFNIILFYKNILRYVPISIIVIHIERTFSLGIIILPSGMEFANHVTLQSCTIHKASGLYFAQLLRNAEKTP